MRASTRSSWCVDPANNAAVPQLMVCGGSRGRILFKQGDHRAWAVQVLLHSGRPMDLWVKQAPQTRPVSILDCGKHVTDGWNLFGHLRVKPPLTMQALANDLSFAAEAWRTALTERSSGAILAPAAGSAVAKPQRFILWTHER
jgi:hypothetical protein